MPPLLILASTSPFRRQLLEKLRLPFSCMAPQVDESALPGETPQALVQRLARAKAEAIATQQREALVIGSDQVAVIDGKILGKPHTHERACAQLQQASGRRVRFMTGLALAMPARRTRVVIDFFDVQFRQLDSASIDRYLRLEEPYQCAGSFKSEGLGITLFESLHGDDPNSLIGLPLIRLVGLLRDAGVDVLTEAYGNCFDGQ